MSDFNKYCIENMTCKLQINHQISVKPVNVCKSYSKFSELTLLLESVIKFFLHFCLLVLLYIMFAVFYATATMIWWNKDIYIYIYIYIKHGCVHYWQRLDMWLWSTKLKHI